MSEEIKQEDKKKFFDRPIPRLVNCNIDYEIDQLRQCLESEGVILSNTDVLKSLDMYCRVSGLDRKVDTNIGIQSIYTWFGALKLNDITTANDKIVEAVKAAIKNINDLVEEKNKITDIDVITNNINIIFKEYSIFMNEIIDSTYDICSSTKDCISVSLYATDSSRSNSFIIVKCSIVEGLKEFVFELTSTVLANKAPESVAIILNSFSEEDQAVLKASREKDN